MAQSKKPNIVVIWGDDIGITNLSCYSDGLMGYRTPNIYRIAQEGMRFTDSYGEQSCTAGRASFITGQHGLRTGMTKVGLPASTLGLRKEDPTIAELLKPQGYVCGQFGKNHLGDRNEMLPTVHGFDEFFGNLYHLNAEEEPETPDYPKNPEFKKRFGPRGVLKCKATDTDDPTVDPRFGKVGKQTIKDTGPLTKKRMETIDDDTADRAAEFIKKNATAMVTNVKGSVALIPISIEAISRVTAKAAKRPAATPMAVRRNPCPTTNWKMLRGWAPRAMRMPISAVRWRTTVASTP